MREPEKGQADEWNEEGGPSEVPSLQRRAGGEGQDAPAVGVQNAGRQKSFHKRKGRM